MYPIVLSQQVNLCNLNVQLLLIRNDNEICNAKVSQMSIHVIIKKYLMKDVDS